MSTDDEALRALCNLDRFVRLMAVAPNIDEVLVAVRKYLASWPSERIAVLHTIAKGWTPFDECLRPYPVFGLRDVRQMCGSVRIRCRELEASGVEVSSELRELDLFFFFAIESLEVHREQGHYDPDTVGRTTMHLRQPAVARDRIFERRP